MKRKTRISLGLIATTVLTFLGLSILAEGKQVVAALTPALTPTLTPMLLLGTPTPTPLATSEPTAYPFPTDAITVSLQQGVDNYVGCRDVHLVRYQADIAYGSASSTYLHVNEINGETRSILLDFDLTGLSLPSHTQILQARIFLYQRQQTGPPRLNVSAYAMNRSWEEREATWNQATANTPWEIPGANGIPEDRQDEGGMPVNIGPWEGWKRRVVTDIVQAWVSDPDRQHGIKLHAAGALTGDAIARFYSSDNADEPALRPRLELVYIIPTPTATSTPTSSPTMTNSPTPTASPTATLAPTDTPTITPTATSTPTATFTPTATSTSIEVIPRRYIPLVLK